MRKIRQLLIVLSLILSLVAAVGCNNKEANTKLPEDVTKEDTIEPSEANPQTENSCTSEDESSTKIFIDSVGREVEVPKNITKIAVSGPMAQIFIYSLAPELIVGISNEWTPNQLPYIAKEFHDLPLLGQLYGGKGELNLEELLKASPDVVIDIGEPKPTITEDFEQLEEQTGLPFIHITATLDSSANAYIMLGDLLSLEDRAKEYSDYCSSVLSRTEALLAKVPEKTNFLYCLGDKGINVLANGSYHSEVLDLVGNNLAIVDEPSSKGTGNETDLEQILLWNPDTIIFGKNSIYDSVYDDPSWKQVAAIKNKKYYEVPADPYIWIGQPPSIQRYLGLMWMCELLYPDISDFDMYEEAKTNYKLFYHIDLTEDMYNELVSNSLGKLNN